MNTKTQELVTAGYALAKGLDAESAKLVKELADELAVQRVRADELNRQVVNVAVENAELKSYRPQPGGFAMMEALDAFEAQDDYPEGGMIDAFEVLCCKRVSTPVTDAAIANIQAQGGEKYADKLDLEATFADESGWDGAAKFLRAEATRVREFSAELRKEAGND